MVTAEELEFGSKLIDTQRSLGKKTNLSYKWSIGIAVFLIFILTDLFTIDSNFTMPWIKVRMNDSYFILLLSIISLFTTQNSFSLMIESSSLNERIRFIYKSFVPNSIVFENDDFNYLEYPDMIGMSFSEKLLHHNLLGKIYYYLSLWVMLLTVTLLPIIAQTLAFIRLSKSFGYVWWLLLIFLLIGFFELIIIYSFYKKAIKSKNNPSN